MSPEIGQLLLTLSMAAAFLQTLVGLGFIKIPLELQNRIIVNLVSIHTLGLIFAIVCLGYSFITDDFSVLYVAQNSHTTYQFSIKLLQFGARMKAPYYCGYCCSPSGDCCLLFPGNSTRTQWILKLNH